MKRVLAALAAALIGLAGATVVSSPARAAWSDCGGYAGTICLFANNDWGLPIWRQYPSQITGCRNLSGFDNVTTIAVNQAEHHLVTLYQFSGCTGESLTLPTSGYHINFSGAWWNDRASAISVTAL